MKIATKNYVFGIFKEYHLIAKKGYGQNFLINENITKGIISNSHIDKDDLIVEIGPGLGALTEELLLSFKRVIGVEIDKNMVYILENTFIDKNFKIINSDFLKLDLNKVLKDEDYKGVSIVSNLPYYITSDILEKIILERVKGLNKIVLMMQKEVGKKLIKSDDKIDTFLKFILTNYCDLRELLYVSKNDFIPRPNVDSIVLELSFKNSQKMMINEEKCLKILKECLKNKRKILLTNLMDILDIEKEKLIRIFNDLKIKENARIEELTNNQFIELVNKI